MRAWSSAGVGAAAAMVVCLRVETTIFQRLGRLWKPRATETLWGALAWICRNLTEAANSHCLGFARIRQRWRISNATCRNSTEAANSHCLGFARIQQRW